MTGATALSPVVLHLGGLHPVEQALVGVIALGPFVVLAVVARVLRRRDLAASSSEDARED